MHFTQRMIIYSIRQIILYIKWISVNKYYVINILLTQLIIINIIILLFWSFAKSIAIAICLSKHNLKMIWKMNNILKICIRFFFVLSVTIVTWVSKDMTGCDITRPGDSSHICRFSPTLTVSREISHIRRLNATPLYICMMIIYLCIRRSNCSRYLPNPRILYLFTTVVFFIFSYICFLIISASQLYKSTSIVLEK